MVPYSQPFLSFMLVSKKLSGGVLAGLDIREQSIQISSTDSFIPLENPGDSVTVQVSLNAIIDSNSPITIKPENDILDGEDPAPGYELKFDPVEFKFTRESARTHYTEPQNLTITLAPKKKSIVETGPAHSLSKFAFLIAERGHLTAFHDSDGQKGK